MNAKENWYANIKLDNEQPASAEWYANVKLDDEQPAPDEFDTIGEGAENPTFLQNRAAEVKGGYTGIGKSATGLVRGAGKFIQAPGSTALSTLASVPAGINTLAARGISGARNAAAGLAQLFTPLPLGETKPEDFEIDALQNLARDTALKAQAQREENRTHPRAKGAIAELGYSMEQAGERGTRAIEKYEDTDPILKAQKKNLADAEGLGALVAMVTNRAALANVLGESSLDMAGGVAAMGLASKIARVGATAAGERALVKAGMSPEQIARAKSIVEREAGLTAQRTAAVTGVGTESISSGMRTEQGTFDAVLQTPFDTLARTSPRFKELLASTGDPDKARERLAIELGAKAGGAASVGTTVGYLVAGAVTNRLHQKLGLTGSDITARMAAGQNVRGREALFNAFVQEPLEEAIQNPLEDLGQYAAETQYNPNAKYDPLGSAASGLVAGAAMAAPGSALGYYVNRNQPVSAVTDEQFRKRLQEDKKKLLSEPHTERGRRLAQAAFQGAQEGQEPIPRESLFPNEPPSDDGTGGGGTPSAQSPTWQNPNDPSITTAESIRRYEANLNAPVPTDEQFRQRLQKDKERLLAEPNTPLTAAGEIDTARLLQQANEQGQGEPEQPAPVKNTPAHRLMASLEAQYGLPAGLLDSMWQQESARGTLMLSPKGAQGHFGFMPATAQAYGLENPNDFAQSAEAAARMMADLLRQYDGNISMALAAYNWGSGNLAKYGLENAPKETRNYIADITGRMAGEQGTSFTQRQIAEREPEPNVEEIEELEKLEEQEPTNAAPTQAAETVPPEAQGREREPSPPAAEETAGELNTPVEMVQTPESPVSLADFTSTETQATQQAATSTPPAPLAPQATPTTRQQVANTLIAGTPPMAQTLSQNAEKPRGAVSKPAKPSAPIFKRRDLVGAVMRVTGGKGISPKLAQDIVGDKANRAGGLRGVFINGGRQDLSDIARLLEAEEGYDLGQGDDIDKANRLAEMLGDMAHGRASYRSMADTEEEASKAQERQYRDRVRQKVERLNRKLPKQRRIRTVGRTFEQIEKELSLLMDMRRDEVTGRWQRRQQARGAQPSALAPILEPVKELLEEGAPTRTGKYATSAAWFDEYQYGITPELSAAQDISESYDDDDIAENYPDAVEAVDEQSDIAFREMSEAEAMRALGFSEQEIENETRRNQPGTTRTGESGRGENDAGRAQAVSTRNAQAVRAQAPARQDEGAAASRELELTGQTEAEAQAQSEREEPEITREQIDRERDAFTLTGESQPSNTAQGRAAQGGMQGGLFTADGRASSEASALETTPGQQTAALAGLVVDERDTGAVVTGKGARAALRQAFPDGLQGRISQNGDPDNVIIPKRAVETIQAAINDVHSRTEIGYIDSPVRTDQLPNNAVVADSFGYLYWVREARHWQVIGTRFFNTGYAPERSLDIAVNFNLRPNDQLSGEERRGPLYYTGKVVDLETWKMVDAPRREQAATQTQDLKGFTRTDTTDGFRLSDGTYQFNVVRDKDGRYQASTITNKGVTPVTSSWAHSEENIVEWAANYRDELKKAQKTETKQQETEPLNKLLGALRGIYTKATEEANDWESRVYKKNNNTVEFAEDETGNREYSIGYINEVKRQRRVEAMRRQADTAQRTIREAEKDPDAFAKKWTERWNNTRASEVTGASKKEVFELSVNEEFLHIRGVGTPTTSPLSQALLAYVQKESALRAEREAREKVEKEERRKQDEKETAEMRKAISESTDPFDVVFGKQPDTKLENFGEQLPGFGRHAGGMKSLGEVTDADIEAKPLSKIWPKESIDAIEDKGKAAVAQTLRDLIADHYRKPRQSYKKRTWLANVKKVLELAGKGLTPATFRDEEIERGSDVLGNPVAKATLLESIDREQWGRIGDVEVLFNQELLEGETDADVQLGRGKGKLYGYVVVDIDGKRNVLTIGEKPAEGVQRAYIPRLMALDKVLPDMVQRVNYHLSEKPAPETKGEKPAERLTKESFRVYGWKYPNGRKPWFIQRRGSRLEEPLFGFDSSKEANAFLNDHLEDVISKYREATAKYRVREEETRNAENRPRVGQDWRKGKDATPEDFTETFAPKGVEFGKWVSQGKDAKERQGFLNLAYDSLRDLAAILNVPPKALFLNGELGLALGSRGFGKFSAHFEPGNVVINLTKTRGAGTLAHEWFHALDSYLDREGHGGKLRTAVEGKNLQTKELTDDVQRLPTWENKVTKRRTVSRENPAESSRILQKEDQYPENWQQVETSTIRPEVWNAFRDLMQAINASPMKKRARSLSTGDYWTRPTELGARSFEQYIIERMNDENFENDFLANVKGFEAYLADRKDAEGNYPYHKPEEMPAIKKAFDNLVATLKTRETEKGVQIYQNDTEYDTTGYNPEYETVQLPTDTERGNLGRQDATSSEMAAGTRAAAGLSRNDAPGRFNTKTKIVTESTRRIGAQRVTNTKEAADALAYLSQGAVERFQALITDKNGKPLAIVGNFKGDESQASVYPTTVLGEAFRVKGAANIWFAHNHPSGLPELSQADMRINEILENVFRGSGITPHGFFAFATPHGKTTGNTSPYQFIPAAGAPISIGRASTAEQHGATVPVVERIFDERNVHGEGINEPDQMIEAAKLWGDGEAGVLLLDYRRRPVGFISGDDYVSGGALRVTGRAAALYRAVSLSGASGVAIVDNGDFTQEGLRNLTRFFDAATTKGTIDIVNTETGESKVSNGTIYDYTGSTFYSRAKKGEDDFDKLMRLSHESHEAEQEVIAIIKEELPELGLEWREDRGEGRFRHSTLTPSAQKAGNWQYTDFDERGPWGDTNYDSVDRALHDFLHEAHGTITSFDGNARVDEALRKYFEARQRVFDFINQTSTTKKESSAPAVENPSTAAQVRAEAVKVLGEKTVRRLEERGVLRFHDDESTLPESVRNEAANFSYQTSDYRGDNEYSIDTTGDAVVGDEVRFERATFAGSWKRPTFAGFERVTGKIIKDSYGADKQQHTFTLELPNGSTMRIKGRNLYRERLYRKPWANEEEREAARREKHARGDAARAQRDARRAEETPRFSASGAIAGVFDGTTIHLVGSGIEQGQTESVLTHEATHLLLAATKMQDSLGYRRLMERLDALWNGLKNDKSVDGKWFKRAQNAMPQADKNSLKDHRLNEFAAYAVEEYLRAPMTLPQRVIKWAKDFLAHVKTWLGLNVGISTKALTADNVGRAAISYLRSQANAGAMETIPAAQAAFSRLMDSISPETQAFQDTERAYGGRDAYDQEKAQGRTKLNYRQWVQVRTPQFKAWFGDWEAVKRQERTRELVTNALADSLFQERTVIAEGRDADPSGRLSETFGFDVVKQYVTPDDIRKSNKRHGEGNEAFPDQIGLTTDDYVKAFEVLRNPETYKRTKSRNGKPSAEFGRRFDDGTLVVAEVETAEDGAVTIKSVWKKIPGRIHAGATTYPNRKTSETAAGVDDIVHSDTLIVNHDTVSKVIDEETGEPKIYYHGTSFDFDTFRDGKPIFLAPKATVAEFFIRHKDSTDGNIISAFVRAANPFSIYNREHAQRMADYLNDARSKLKPDSIRAGVLKRIEGTFELVAEGDPKAVRWSTIEHEEVQKAIRDMGFDGFYTNELGNKNIAVYSANQVKSAISNTGAFSGDGNMMFSRRKAVQGEPMPDETTVQHAKRTWQDRFIRFRVLREWLKSKGVKLSEEADVYLAEERMHAKIANQIEDLHETVVQPLLKKIGDAGFTLTEVAQFLHAQHAEERNVQIAKINQDMPDGGSGMSTTEARDILAVAPQELRDIANEFRQITERTKALYLDNGIITQEMVDAWENAYDFYVPLKGGPDSTVKRGVGGHGLKTKFASKRALGHDTREEGEYILENIVADFERAVMTVERNRVGQHLLAMALEIQNPEIATVDKPVKRKMLRDAKAYAVVKNGAVVASFDNYNAARAFIHGALAGHGKGKSGYSIDVSNDPSVVYAASPMLADNEVLVYVDGHTVRMQINDELLARAYGQLGQEGMGAAFRVGARLNRYLSGAYTGYNPQFLFTNMARDFFEGFANVAGEAGIAVSARAAANYGKSFAELLKYAVKGEASDAIKMYREDGGNTGAAYLSDLERMRSNIAKDFAAYQGVAANLRQGDKRGAARALGREAFNKTLRWIEHLNMAGENAMRLSIYKAMLETGHTRAEAASLAKNATINFNRRGEWGAQANAAYLFFNASVQGAAATLHALTKGKHRGQAQALAGAMAGLGFLVAASFGGGGDEDEYDKLSEWTKAKNLLISANGKDAWAKVPVPYGYGFFYNLGRYTSDAMRKGEWGKMPWQLAAQFVEDFTPFGTTVAGESPAGSMAGGDATQTLLGALPTIIQPLGVTALNRTTFGQPLMPESKFDESQPDREKMWRGTRGTLSDQLAGALSTVGVDVSPETLKYLWRTATGGAGRTAEQSFNAAVKTLTGQDQELREIPFARLVFTKTDVRDARNRYYTLAGEAKAAAEKFRRAAKSNDAERIAKAADDAAELRALNTYAEKMQDTIKAYRDWTDRINQSKDYTPAEKNQLLRDAEKKEQQAYDDYIQSFKTLTKMGRERRAAQ
jgi:soluble lytic murein transglycosylase-like protein